MLAANDTDNRILPRSRLSAIRDKTRREISYIGAILQRAHTLLEEDIPVSETKGPEESRLSSGLRDVQTRIGNPSSNGNMELERIIARFIEENWAETLNRFSFETSWFLWTSEIDDLLSLIPEPAANALLTLRMSIAFDQWESRLLQVHLPTQAIFYEDFREFIPQDMDPVAAMTRDVPSEIVHYDLDEADLKENIGYTPPSSPHEILPLSRFDENEQKIAKAYYSGLPFPDI
jgi:hypothetical protein